MKKLSVVLLVCLCFFLFIFTIGCSEKEFKITYDPNGGILNEKVQVFKSGEAVELLVPTRDGYQFVGWYDGEDKVEKIVDNNYSLVAKWKEINKDTVFDLDGGILNKTIDDEPIKNGCKFIGWYNGEERIEKIEKYNQVLKAKWENYSFTYTITDNEAIITGINSDVTSYSFPDYVTVDNKTYNITSIKESAFKDNNKIKDLSFGNSLKVINKEAFSNCVNLEKISGLNNVTEIGAFCFFGCTKLESVGSLDKITSFGNGFIAGCQSLKEIIVDNDYYCVSDGVIFNKDKTKLIAYLASNQESKYLLLSSVKEINAFAFYKTNNLKEVVLNKELDEIGIQAFEESSIEKIDFNSCNITKIPQRCFYNCLNLDNVVLPSNVTYIINEAFYGCANLKSITLNDGLKSISTKAFNNCLALKEIIIPLGVKTIINSIFLGCSDLVVKPMVNKKPESWTEDWSQGVKSVVWGSLEFPNGNPYI